MTIEDWIQPDYRKPQNKRQFVTMVLLCWPIAPLVPIVYFIADALAAADQDKH